MDTACVAATGDVDRGTAFSECASNPFADTATPSCDNCYQLIVPAHFCLLASTALIGRAKNDGRILAEQLFGSIEFCLTPTRNNNISPASMSALAAASPMPVLKLAKVGWHALRSEPEIHDVQQHINLAAS